MKKLNYLFTLICVAVIFGSCAVGTYVPHAVTLLGSQTTVVLDKANYRVVRNVEAVVEVDNDRLRRADVEKSAFAELMRRYPLTGSQAYINVVCEEMQREKVFAFHTGRYALKQYVAVRATIIEFLQDNGEPVKSVASPYNSGQVQQRVIKEEPSKTIVTHENEKEESPTEEEEMAKLKQLAKNKANKLYVAYLYKSKKLNGDKSVLDIFNWSEIASLADNWSLQSLRKNSKEHDVEFERYAL